MLQIFVRSSCCVVQKKSCKRLPPEGKLSRKRLMRGIKFLLRNAYKNSRIPLTQGARQPHSVTTLHLPNQQKLPPRAPALNKANQIFALQGRVLLGEVLGGEGRFGGGGTPLSRGVPPPPRSSFLPTTYSKCNESAVRKACAPRRESVGISRFAPQPRQVTRIPSGVISAS